jgi:hypothetical protein
VDASSTPDELKLLAILTPDEALRARLICALSLIDPETARGLQ